MAKGWYPHYNTQDNLDYFGSIPDPAYYGVDEMSAGERREFIEWYDTQRAVLFDNRLVLETYCQYDVTETGVPCVQT